MSLIVCPECQNTVSDKATYCVHCGYPISSITSDQIQNSVGLYQIILQPVRQTSWANAITYISRLTGAYMDGATHLVQTAPCSIVQGVPYATSLRIQQMFQAINVQVDILADHESVKPNAFIANLQLPTDEENQRIHAGLLENQKSSSRSTVTCPRCGSTQITTGQRGWKLTTGFLGSSKTVNRCANCGYKWEPSYWTRNK